MPKLLVDPELTKLTHACPRPPRHRAYQAITGFDLEAKLLRIPTASALAVELIEAILERADFVGRKVVSRAGSQSLSFGQSRLVKCPGLQFVENLDSATATDRKVSVAPFVKIIA